MYTASAHHECPSGSHLRFVWSSRATHRLPVTPKRVVETLCCARKMLTVQVQVLLWSRRSLWTLLALFCLKEASSKESASTPVLYACPRLNSAPYPASAACPRYCDVRRANTLFSSSHTVIFCRFPDSDNSLSSNFYISPQIFFQIVRVCRLCNRLLYIAKKTVFQWKQASRHLWKGDIDYINLTVKFRYWSCSDARCNR